MFDPTSLTALLVDNGIAIGVARKRNGTLFSTSDPLPQAGRDGEPEHPDTQCLAWLGGLESGGYGYVQALGTFWRVHQLTFHLTGGIVPAGLILGHLCERRPCGRPDHVRPITRQQNSREGAGRSYPERLLMLAPEADCGWCSGPTTVSIQVYSNRPPSWLWTCSPCYARHCHVRKATGSAKGVPSGRRALRISGPALDLITT